MAPEHLRNPGRPFSVLVVPTGALVTNWLGHKDAVMIGISVATVLRGTAPLNAKGIWASIWQCFSYRLHGIAHGFKQVSDQQKFTCSRWIQLLPQVSMPLTEVINKSPVICAILGQLYDRRWPSDNWQWAMPERSGSRVNIISNPSGRIGHPPCPHGQSPQNLTPVMKETLDWPSITG